MTSPQTTRLLQRVERRLRLASIARRTYWSLLAGGALYATLLLASRLLGLIPDRFHFENVLAVPAAALVVGLAFHRRPAAVEAARRIDRACGTKDLFLTVAMLDRSPGEFKPLVSRAAEDRAASIRPADVVSMRFARRVFNVAGLLALLLAGVFFLPHLDPFGRIDAAESLEQEKQKLAETRKATTLRVAEVQRAEKEAVETKEIKKVVDKLKQDFRKMKPDAPQQNLAALGENQKVLGEKYRKLSTDKLREFLADKPMSQKFGADDREKLEKWNRELQQGSTESLKQELEELQEQLEKIAKESDPVKKAEMSQKARKQLQELANFLGKKANSNELSATLQRAMEQMELEKKEGLSMEASEAAKQSLDLAKLELQQLAQSIEDLQDLEKSLKALQLARQANSKQSLDGKQCEGCQSMDDYMALYESLVKAQGQGDFAEGDSDKQGNGMGRPGKGKGGVAPEDDSTKTAFKDEQSKSAIKAGKILLTIKTQGMGEKGDARTRFRDAVKSVRNGASEAILTEQIPPGYHDGIKKYFDSFDEAPAAADNSAPDPAPAEKSDAGK